MHDDDLESRKRSLRTDSRRTREAAWRTETDESRRQACRHLLEALRVEPGCAVSGYIAYRTERDPMDALREADRLGARLALPAVVAPGSPLEFRRWRPGEPLESGEYGIPVPRAGEPLRPSRLVVPLLAWDRAGYRLGYGGGYYDRTLAALRADGPCRAVGFAFAAQEVERVPAGERDIPLDAVVTEDGTVEFGG